MKTLKFASNLVPLILNGDKTATWRLFDDKDLIKGDKVLFLDQETKELFAEADLIEVKETTFRDLTLQDKDGHEKYITDKEMLETFSKCYNTEVNLNTPLKVVKFKIIKKLK
ncbi:MAG: ASCH domain-containing protein [Candidatus Berkelbacteria bacterium]